MICYYLYMMNESLTNADVANPYNGPPAKKIGDFWIATNCVERDVCQYILTSGYSTVVACSSYNFPPSNNNNGGGNLN